MTKTFGTVGDEAISATGIHLKAPWQDLIRFDIRNQTIALDEGGGRISTVTSDNATVAYDVTIRYSLNPGKLSEIVRQYPDQESFISRAVLPGVSSVTRDAPTTFTAATVRQSRAQLALRITEGLEKRLGEVGVTVEQVDPQGHHARPERPGQLRQGPVLAGQRRGGQGRPADRSRQRRDHQDRRAGQSDADQIIRCGATSTPVDEVINGKTVRGTKVMPVPNGQCQNRLNEQVLTSKYIEMLRDAADKGNTLYVLPQGSSNLLQLPAPAAGK